MSDFKKIEYSKLLEIDYKKLYAYIETLDKFYNENKNTFRSVEAEEFANELKKAVRVRALQYHLENDYLDKRIDVKEKVYREYPLITAFKKASGLELQYKDLVAIDYIMKIKK